MVKIKKAKTKKAKKTIKDINIPIVPSIPKPKVKKAAKPIVEHEVEVAKGPAVKVAPIEMEAPSEPQRPAAEPETGQPSETGPEIQEETKAELATLTCYACKRDVLENETKKCSVCNTIVCKACGGCCVKCGANL